MNSLICFLISATFASPLNLSPLGLQKVEDKTPELAMIDENGHTFNLGDFKGQPMILHFWASWCTSCKHEIPILVKFVKDTGGPKFLAVSVDKKEDLKAAQVALGQTSLLLAVQDGDARKFWAWGVPVTYFIDSQGRIRARAMGEKDWNHVPKDEFKKFLDSLK